MGEAALAGRAAICESVPGAIFPEGGRSLAATLALAARRLASAGRTVSPAELRPLYLRDADIRKPRVP